MWTPEAGLELLDLVKKIADECAYMAETTGQQYCTFTEIAKEAEALETKYRNACDSMCGGGPADDHQT